VVKPADPASELYALPLDEFTPARNELANKLAAAGDKPAAEAVRALRKPSVPAWAVNQVARSAPKGIAALFDTGKQLHAAQQKLIRSGDTGAVKEATTAERAAVRALVAEAKSILTEAGHTPNEATLDRVADTFYATAVDDEGRELVRTGTLTKELKRVGFGDVGGLSVVPSARAAAAKAPKPKAQSARLEKEAENLRAAAEEAEEAAAQAEALASDLATAADEARAKADAAKEKARFARRGATEARRDSDRAARRLERTR
jgi:hypothetical protein